jgi:small subunit ribosomal protein S1
MLEAGQVVEARVTGVVTGKENKPAGLELEVAGHKAFMPAGQIGFDRVEDLSIFVGEKMKCAVARVERMGKGNIVLSRREVLAVERRENADKLRASLKEGDTIEGTVRKIMPFGAFVDLGGIDGLVHQSDITYDRMGFGEKAIAKHVTEGQRVRVRILKLDFENNRIALGMKQVMGDPFAQTAQNMMEGGEVAGKVVRIAEFGAFVELSPGVEGLVHISEIDHKRVNKVEEVLKVDEIVRAKVLKIDPANRRISLSVKALKPLPELSLGGGAGDKGKGKKDRPGRSAEEILKETPALRRMREKYKQFQFKGGLS